jgi:hypothetical protein
LREREGPTPKAWEGEGFPSLQFCQNARGNPFGVAQNLTVPEPEYAPSQAFEPSSAARIFLVLKVLTAIRLDDQEVFGAGKIGDERPDRDLPAELVTA